MAKAARRTLVRKLPRVRRTGFLLTLCVAIVALAVQVAAASAAAPPPTLTGETLLGGLFTPEASSVVVTSASCNPGGHRRSPTKPPAPPHCRTPGPTARRERS